MEDNSCFPNNVTYNDVVRGFLRCNEVSEMASFMKEIAGRGFSFDATTTGFLINITRENRPGHHTKASLENWR
uniref:Pentatricopeptide repeat-containing protein n=1 Tax=Solanum lycopersicum TaxID=4081 RepID=A0A3Q7GMF8_SOLLC